MGEAKTETQQVAYGACDEAGEGSWFKVEWSGLELLLLT